MADYTENAPFLERIEYARRKPELRAINQEYYIELAAKNVKGLALLHAHHLRTQTETSIATLNAISELSDRQNAANALLGEIGEGIGELVEVSRTISNQLTSLESTLQRGVDQIVGALNHGFYQVVEALGEQKRVLTEIALIMSRPYETKARELLLEGQKWLEFGTRTKGQEHDENWNDALRLFKRVIENDIGRQNYVAWFNIGFLQWEHLNALPEAEKSFFNAQRYSAPDRNLWYTKSLRYMAEVQYLQGRVGEARDTGLRALAVKREYETLYNVARYEGRLGNRDSMIRILDECITLRPNTVGVIFSEQDFQA